MTRLDRSVECPRQLHAELAHQVVELRLCAEHGEQGQHGLAAGFLVPFAVLADDGEQLLEGAAIVGGCSQRIGELQPRFEVGGIGVDPPAQGGDIDAAYESAVAEVENLRTLLQTRQELAPIPLSDRPPIAVPPGNFTRERFEQAVDATKEFIRSGDIIQIVLSQRFVRPFAKSPLDLYRALRTVNPSPYMFLLDTGDFAIVGASPEVHVKVTDGLVESRPIAGTRPRGATPEADATLEKDLLADEKEKAEHLMLVDLARNDLGRVCQYGTVTVPEFMVVERYSHVMHIVSQVEGKLRPDRNAFDVMRATFPAGTVSGAPKIRAMQIIAQFEKLQRGFYAGALGYFSYDGNLDCCITLRTALLKDGQITIQAGAGLVADSVPAAEYQETINKASALFKAVAIAEGA